MDYKKLGLKCGIEIHNQLNTSKLFCDCPSIIRDDDPDVEVKRRLRATVGETGKVDQAALQESLKGKTYVYQAYSDTTCLVELDEEPPHLMNKDALNTALQVALILGAKPIDEVQTMRKTVVDGSNTTGFQRTSQIARSGFLETTEGKVTIEFIGLEEDAAKIVERTPTQDTYNLSRLGIPLLEVATGPDIYSPTQCQEAAAKIGMIIRSTGKSMRGIGTTRQDVNVSIAEGDRIEIKGAQDLKLIPTWVENEVTRQVNIVDIKKTLGKIELERAHYNLKDIFQNTEAKIIKNAKAIGAIKLNNFKGLIGKEIQPGRRLGTEFSDYAKVRAGVGGIFHSDELPKYGISEEEVKRVRDTLNCQGNDAFVIVADSENKVREALNAVTYRAKLCEIGVIREVRKPNPDGTSSYMRPMPGAARMYPETDTLPIKVDLKKIKLPELLTDKAKRYVREFNLNDDMANAIVKDQFKLFERLANECKQIKPAFLAEVLIGAEKNIKSQFNIEIKPKDRDFEILFKNLNENKIPKDAIYEILKKAHSKPIEEVVKNFKPIDNSELESQIKEIIEKNKGAPFNALMGLAMKELRGKADGKTISELLKKLS